MPSDYIKLLESILKNSARPALFAPGEEHFWDDPHISQSMLEAHLDPTTDAASRRPETIDKTVKHLVSNGFLKDGQKALDLGCGPGLYARRLAREGIKISGVDISERSIEYARKQALQQGLEIDYTIMDFFDIDYDNEFDAVLQIYGELATFSDDRRDNLLKKINRALKPGGLFIFDISCRMVPNIDIENNHWDIGDGGFWRPGKHLVLEQNYTYPEQSVGLRQNIVIDDDGKVAVYRNWFHDYTLQTITPVLEKAGFRITQTWNDLTGTPYAEGGDWLALVSQKVS